MNCVITSKGAELLRNAAENSEKVVFTRAVASSNFDKDRSDLCAVPLSWFNGIDGSIDAVSAGKVAISFSAADDSAPIKSVCLCAQVYDADGYEDENDTVFAVWSDDNALFDAAVAFSMIFDLPVDLTGLVDASGTIPNDAGLSVVSYESGTLTVKLADGTVLEISATEAE